MSREVLRPFVTGNDVYELFLELQDCSKEETAEDANMISDAVADHYRCPKDFLDVVLTGDLSSDSGYFRFGREVICFGRSTAGTRQARPEPLLTDLLSNVISDDAKLELPFDPTEVIDNLRLEHYLAGSFTDYEGLVKKIYYRLRPFTTPFLRKQIQRLHARNWKHMMFPHWPVDTTVENLCETLMLLSLRTKGVDGVPFVWFWPRGSRGCITMTHDVETEAGRDFCAEMMDLDDEFGIKASFQIIPEKRYAVPAGLLESIRSRGFEIGVQDLNHDGRLFDSREEFLRRAQLINRYGREYGARGFRAAVLYRKPEWYSALDFSFDMSIPNVAHLDPQRGGCCTVMPYFIGDILELPVTTTQDYTVFHLLNQRSIDLWKTQTELILDKNGLVSFIIHPDYVMEPEAKPVHAKLLDYLRRLREKENIWFALPSEIDLWWRARSKMSVVPRGDSFSIEGEGAERAELAFARGVNGQLVYQFVKANGAC
jgi:hypothetical protein